MAEKQIEQILSDLSELRFYIYKNEKDNLETAQRNISGIFNVGTDRYGTLKDDLNGFFQKVKLESGIKEIFEYIDNNGN